MSDEYRRFVAGQVLRDWRVRFVCQHDLVRMQRIVDVVWETCDQLRDVIDWDNKREISEVCELRLRRLPDFQDTVSFIPIWLLAIMLKIIISLLIDYWFEYQSA